MCSSLFGAKTPKIQQAAPTPTTQVSDENLTTGDSVAEKKNKRKRGFESTNLAPSILGESTGKKTLGG